MNHKRRILFMTSPVPRYTPLSTEEKLPPLGIGSLIATLRKQGHRVFFRDEYLRRSGVLTSGFLQKMHIDWIGIYSNSVCFQGTLQLLRTIQAQREQGKWNGRIAVGGPHASLRPADFPSYVDYVVKGEGESVIGEVIANDFQSRVVEGEPIQDLDKLPRLPWQDFVRLPYDWCHEWIDTSPVFSLNTSRGCPHNCTFCSVKSISGRKYRAMSADRVFDDIMWLHKDFGAKGIYFREDNFTCQPDRVRQLCKLLVANDAQIDWLCEARVDSLQDPDFVSMMAEAGCRWLYIGVESGSERLLSFLQKGITTDETICAFDNAKKAGIRTYASVMYGIPTETPKDRNQTEQLLERIRPDFVGRGVYVGLPGSELYRYVKEHQLYEYEDEAGILYLKGHNRRISRYYGTPSPHRKIPFTTSCAERVFYFVARSLFTLASHLLGRARAKRLVRVFRRIRWRLGD